MSRYLTVCAIVRNEGPYLAEWIEHHLMHGVEHFIIYDNCSKDGTVTTLMPYMKAGLVTLKMWLLRPGQFSAYNDCLRYMSEWPEKDSEWVAFIDADEFLWSPETNSITEALRLIDESNPTADAIAVKWRLFGSNNHTHKTDALVTARFTGCAQGLDKHCKSIVRRRNTLCVGKDPHTFRVKGRRINEEGDDIPEDYATSNGHRASLLRINHYVTKSKDEYLRRKVGNMDAGSGYQYPTMRVFEMFEAHDRNEAQDFTLANLAPKLEERICQRYSQPSPVLVTE